MGLKYTLALTSSPLVRAL